MHKPGSIYSAAILLACVSLIAVHAVSVRSEARHGNTPAASSPIRDDFSTGNLNAWEMPFPEDWEILKEGSINYLHMKRNRPPGVPRRPLQFARLRGVEVGSFILNVNVRRAGGSMIVVFNYVDTLHFYYVHLSENPGTEVAVHNGIFIVDGGDRRRIAGLDAAAALPDRSWHDVRIVRNVITGSSQVFLNKETRPRFSVLDRTFTRGQIGLGSFDETGDFSHFALLRSEDQLSPAAKE
jgi:hypothetical protein